MSNSDEPTRAKGRMTITVNIGALRDGNRGLPEDEHEALMKTLTAVVEKVERDLRVLPFPGGEWIPEKHPVSTPHGAATIALS